MKRYRPKQENVKKLEAYLTKLKKEDARILQDIRHNKGTAKK